MSPAEIIGMLASLLAGGGLSALLAWRINKRKGSAEASMTETEAYSNMCRTMLESNEAMARRLSEMNKTIDRDRDSLHEERERTRVVSDRLNEMASKLHDAEEECNRLNAEKGEMFKTIIRLTENLGRANTRLEHYTHWHCQETREGKVLCKRIPPQDPPESVYTDPECALQAAPDELGAQALISKTVNR